MEKGRYFSFDELQTITKQFAVERKLGDGGYGVVYKGVQDDGEVIAVKKLHSELQGTTDAAFDNEILNLSKIDHPNVVRVIGYCNESRRKFFERDGQTIAANDIVRLLCFEYVDGGSLDKYISEDKPCDLDWPTCYRIVRGTCEGLNHLHAQGQPIYHRDLKPANILLDRNMMPKIADLGLSKIVSSTTTYRTQSLLPGTLGYMPPEYAKTGVVSPTFDVFSLGVIIIRIMDGNLGHCRRYDMSPQEFTEHVTKNWKERLQGTSGSSQEIYIRQVKMCVDIAISCVEHDRTRRPRIRDIVKKMKALDHEIGELPAKMTFPKDPTRQISSHSNVLAIDPSRELCLPFQPMTDISCFFQLRNMADGSIAYNIKTDKTKYHTQPNKGLLHPCSRTYICVTLRAQKQAPTNMQCDDAVLVQCVNISQDLTSDQITDGFFEKAIREKVVDVVTLPIVYIALDQFHEKKNCSIASRRRQWARPQQLKDRDELIAVCQVLETPCLRLSIASRGWSSTFRIGFA